MWIKVRLLMCLGYRNYSDILGYNDFGYNEFKAINNKFCHIFWSTLRFNHVTFVITNVDVTLKFVITEFDSFR